MAMVWLPFAQAEQNIHNVSSRYYQNNASRNVGAEVTISVAQLPPEGRAVLKAIKQGGPFEYDRDGVVFGNRERILPKQQRGYYHEYTVKTPGVRHRGTRRIVCGVVPECYYTADHYQSFARIKE
ncbi:MAG: ribonuclease [Gallionella sp.]|nr:ribonuclease [Gallionella sp.]